MSREPTASIHHVRSPASTSAQYASATPKPSGRARDRQRRAFQQEQPANPRCGEPERPQRADLARPLLYAEPEEQARKQTARRSPGRS